MVIAALSLQSISGQDLLKLKSGKELKVDIVDENADVYRYRDFGVADSPLYTVAKDLVESVVHDKKSGTELIEKQAELDESRMLKIKRGVLYSEGRLLRKPDVKTLMQSYPEIYELYSSGTREGYIGGAIAGTGIGLALITYLQSISPGVSRPVQAGLYTVSTGVAVTGIVLAVKGSRKVKQSVNMYNTRVVKPSAMIHMEISPHGVGMLVTF